MEELVRQLSEKAGIGKDKAEQVVQFLKEHAIDVPQWVTTDPSKLATMLSEKTGLSKDNADKVVATLQANAGEWTKSLGQQGPGAAQKAKDAVAGLFGRK